MDSSAIIILYKDNKFLLQLRDDNAPTAPNEWAFFGGGIEQESPKEAIVRETKEELSYELTNPLLFAKRRQHHPHFEFEYVFIEEYNNQPLTQNEGADMAWFNISEIDYLEMEEHKKHLFRLVYSYLKEQNNIHLKRSAIQ